MSRVTVLGAGAWGTAIALWLARQPGHRVTLWGHSPGHCAEMLAERENRKYLPGHALPTGLEITSDLEAAARGDSPEILITVVPSQHTRAHLVRLAPLLGSGQTLVSATKGLEDSSYLRMSQVLAEVLRDHALELPIGVLSGPSFAQEVAAGLPAAVTIAFPRMEDAARVQALFSTPSLRLYRNDDVIGVELGGALKNVIAIAAGAVSGSGFGHNATAALMTRGIAETTRLALACGGRSETLAGLSGVGDLVLTCTGSLSRNRLVGMELGRGRELAEILASLGGKVAEGVRTTAAALGLAARHGVDMPITRQVAAVLRGERSPHDAMQELMSRASRGE
ncbi:MAG TPA: NAD(P)H-dependent glycerol-3-phosphate dehydrogenase [Acidobacteriaceae bacterium]